MSLHTINAENATLTGDAVADGTAIRITDSGDGTGTATATATLDAGEGLAFDHSTVVESVTSTTEEYYTDSEPLAVSTSYFGVNNYFPSYAFDTDLPLIGSSTKNSWWSDAGEVTNQRIAYDRGESPGECDRCRIQNQHLSGTLTSQGIKTITIYGSDSILDYTGVFGTDNAMTLLFTGSVPEHTATDTIEWFYAIFNVNSSHRYFIVEMYDNWGSSYHMSVRRFELGYIVEPYIAYDYTDDAAATNFDTAGNITALQAVGKTDHQLEAFRLNISGPAGSLVNFLTINTYVTDNVPPGLLASKLFDGSTYYVIGFTENDMPDDYDHIELKRIIDGVTEYLANLENLPVWVTTEPEAGGYWEFRGDSAAHDSPTLAFWVAHVVCDTIGYYGRAVDLTGNAGAFAIATLAAGSSTEAPATPTGTATAGDGAIVLDLVADDLADEIFPRWRTLPDGAWSEESEDYKLVGSGQVSIPGDNHTTIVVTWYAKRGGLMSDWAEPLTLVPTDGSNAPRGFLAQSKELLRDMLADCPEWQSWVEGDATLAAEHIRYFAIDADEGDEAFATTLAAARPLIILGSGQVGELNATSGGSRTFMTPSSSILMELEAEVPEAYQGETNLAGAAVHFDSRLGVLLEELAARSGMDGKLDIRGVQIQDVYRTTREEARTWGDVILARLEIAWGRG